MADEIGHEGWACVAVGDIVFGEDFVGEFGAGFEGKFFGKDKSVIAVEEEFDDLNEVSVVVIAGGGVNRDKSCATYLAHLDGCRCELRGVCV